MTSILDWKIFVLEGVEHLEMTERYTSFNEQESYNLFGKPPQ